MSLASRIRLVPTLGLVNLAKAYWNPKMQCLMRPAQSGKTRTMQEMIRDYRRLSGEDAITFVIVSKNRALVSQLHARMANDLYESADDLDDDDSDSSTADAKIEGDVFSWMSGTKNTNISADALFAGIILGKVKMVICCSHKTRLQYLMKLLNLLDEAKTRSLFKSDVNVFIDEADDSIKLWSHPELNMTSSPSVRSLTLVSATFDSVIEHYGRIKIIGCETTHPDCYVKLSDCEIIEFECMGAAPAYFKSVYAQYKGRLNRPGMRIFAPGDLLVATHDEIAEFLLSEGFAVAILNGRRKVILLPDNPVPLIIAKYASDEPEEVGKTIARMYRDFKIARFPFAITGQMCLGRGLTFQCQIFRTVYAEGNFVKELDYDFLFDAGIIPMIPVRATAYQCLARILGNTHDFENYKPCTVYTSARVKNLVLSSERIAVNTPRLVAQHKLEWVDENVMNWADHGDAGRYWEEVTRPTLNHTTDDTLYRIFRTEETARQACKILGKRFVERAKNEAGFYERNLGGAASGGMRIVQTLDCVKRVHNTYSGSGDSKGYWAFIPVYNDIRNANTLRFIIPLIDPHITAAQKAAIMALPGGFTISQVGEINYAAI
jgi:hypothetical protein